MLGHSLALESVHQAALLHAFLNVFYSIGDLLLLDVPVKKKGINNQTALTIQSKVQEVHL
jgi:hypothetical protein